MNVRKVKFVNVMIAPVRTHGANLSAVAEGTNFTFWSTIPALVRKIISN